MTWLAGAGWLPGARADVDAAPPAPAVPVTVPTVPDRVLGYGVYLLSSASGNLRPGLSHTSPMTREAAEAEAGQWRRGGSFGAVRAVVVELREAGP